nr:MAG TPA: hypothetical protein [Caudoviricetes sp.]
MGSDSGQGGTVRVAGGDCQSDTQTSNRTY